MGADSGAERNTSRVSEAEAIEAPAGTFPATSKLNSARRLPAKLVSPANRVTPAPFDAVGSFSKSELSLDGLIWTEPAKVVPASGQPEGLVDLAFGDELRRSASRIHEYPDCLGPERYPGIRGTTLDARERGPTVVGAKTQKLAGREQENQQSEDPSSVARHSSIIQPVISMHSRTGPC